MLCTISQIVGCRKYLKVVGVMLGAKVYETEAEIKEALKSNIDYYGAFWKEYNCPVSLTDPG